MDAGQQEEWRVASSYGVEVSDRSRVRNQFMTVEKSIFQNYKKWAKCRVISSLQLKQALIKNSIRYCAWYVFLYLYPGILSVRNNSIHTQ